MNKRDSKAGRNITLFSIIMAVIIIFNIGILASMLGSCSGSDRTQAQSQSSQSKEDAEFEEWMAESKYRVFVNDYEIQLSLWTSNYDFFMQWYNSGESSESFKSEVVEWANEIILYDRSKVPDSYKVVHEQWAERAVDFKNTVLK